MALLAAVGLVPRPGHKLKDADPLTGKTRESCLGRSQMSWVAR